MNILDPVRKNKEWLFSGIGAVVLLALFSEVKTLIVPQVNTQGPRPTSTKQSLPSNEPRPLLKWEDVNEILKDSSLTKLQRDQYISRQEGKRVLCEGYIRDIQTLGGSDADIVVIVAPEWSDHSKHLFTATFYATSKDDLLLLHPGDWIQLEGTLRFSSLGFDKTPSVRDCDILTFRRGQRANNGVLK
jgi:hypothetical protein